MWVRSLGQEGSNGENGNPLQCSCLENATDSRAWRAAVQGVSKCWDSLGKNTGVGGHSLLQGIFLTQGSTCISCITGGFFTAEPPRKPWTYKRKGQKQIRSSQGEVGERLTTRA